MGNTDFLFFIDAYEKKVVLKKDCLVALVTNSPKNASNSYGYIQVKNGYGRDCIYRIGDKQTYLNILNQLGIQEENE